MPTAINDITRDKLQSKSLSKEGYKNWDNIDWGARAREATDTLNMRNNTPHASDSPCENRHAHQEGCLNQEEAHGC